MSEQAARLVPMLWPLRVVIPGEPHAQQRHRSTKRGHTYDPKANVSWKGAAQVHMQDACEAHGWVIPDADVPLEVSIIATWICPRSEWRKREPRPRTWHTKRGDVDNVAKAVLDAGTGVLWVDDAQVSRCVVTKWVGAQGESPGVAVTVRVLKEVGDGV